MTISTSPAAPPTTPPISVELEDAGSVSMNETDLMATYRVMGKWRILLALLIW